jgi:acetyl esterase/lipase
MNTRRILSILSPPWGHSGVSEVADLATRRGLDAKSSVGAFGADPTDKYASPLLHDRIKDLPKVYLNCAGQDTLRDDARLMKELLDKHR